MEDLYIKKTKETPLIILNNETGEYSFTGNSVKQVPDNMYENCILWLEENLSEIKTDINVNFHFNLINSTSHKYIFQILLILQDYTNITINWKYDEDDEEIKEMGEDFKEILNSTSFNIICSYKKYKKI